MAKNRICIDVELGKIEQVLEERFLSTMQNAIEEKNTDAKLKSFKMTRDVVGHSELEYKIYRFDPNHETIFPYFKSGKGLNKVCDYIIFVENRSDFFVFLIEMKKGTESPFKQLCASECFVQFILESAKRIGVGLQKPLIVRKIGVTDNSVSSKKVTTFYKNFRFDKDGYMKIQGKSALRLMPLIEASIV